MGMVCYLRQISRAESEEIDVNPSKAYEIILGNNTESLTEEQLLRRSENAIAAVNALHERDALTHERVREANAKHKPVSEDLRAKYEKWLAEYKALMAPWSARNKALGKRGEDPDELRIDKSWHGLHFLLTGRLDGGAPPISRAILGGKVVPDRRGLMGFGPGHKLTPVEVREVSGVLAILNAADLVSRYDADEMRRNEAYAMGVPPDEDREYLSVYYEKVRSFYAEAASKQSGMLIYLR